MLPIHVSLSAAVGASVVLVNRSTTARQGPVRSTALGALLVFLALIVVPSAAYLMYRYPDWMLMYKTSTNEMDLPIWGLLAIYPGAALVAFYATRHLVRIKKPLGAWGVFAGTALLSFAILIMGAGDLAHVGTTSQVTNNLGQPLAESPLAYLLGAVWLAFIAGWTATIWRLIIYGRAMRLRDGDVVEATIVRDEDKSVGGKTKVKKK
jgi:hypothetical protein